jgi:hypothetical protein
VSIFCITLVPKIDLLEVALLYSNFVTPGFHVLRVAVKAPASRVCLWAVLYQVPVHVEHLSTHKAVAKGGREVGPHRETK